MEKIIKETIKAVKNGIRKCNQNTAKIDRNFEIYEKRNDGAKFVDLAKEYGISANRARQAYRFACAEIKHHLHWLELKRRQELYN